MVIKEDSEHRQYATDGDRVSDNCFAVKPVPGQINECEWMINNVHTILKSLNIHVSKYETELDDLKYIVSSFNDSLKINCLNNSNLTDRLGRVSNKSEE